MKDDSGDNEDDELVCLKEVDIEKTLQSRDSSLVKLVDDDAI